MRNAQFLRRLGATMALLASATLLKAEPFLYVSDILGSQLVKVDVGTGATSVIGPFNQPWCTAIAISPQGDLYTVTQGFPPGSPNPQLATVNITTGEATPFGVNLSPEIFMGIGFTPDGTLYGVNAMSGPPNEGSLYRFDPVTGVASKVKLTGSCGMIMDLACHPDGTLYGADPTSLYRINPNTGQATLVVATAHTAIMGLAIDDDGIFYVTEIVPGAPLLRLDAATGTTSPVPGVTLNYPHGLEFIPTPRSRPVTLAFKKSPVTPDQWLGTVDTNSDGLPDGDLVYDQVPGSLLQLGQTIHFEGDYAIETDLYSFRVRLNVVLNLSSGSIRGNGVITQGWLDGVRVHLEAELVPGGVAGVMRLLSGTAN